MKKIYGFAGPAGAGKTTAADMLREYYEEMGAGVEILSYATPLKECLWAMFGLPREAFFGTKQEKERINQFWGVSGRELMQYFGTELLRDQFLNPVHTLRMLDRINRSAADVVIVDDVRFADEVDALWDLSATLVKIEPSNVPEIISIRRPRTTEQWRTLDYLGYEEKFIKFLKDQELGLTHRSEDPVGSDIMIGNDHGLGLDFLRRTVLFTLTEER